MRHAGRFAMFCLLPALSSIALGQVSGLASVAGPTADPGYAQVPPVGINTLPAGYSVNSLLFDANTGALLSGGAGTASLSSYSKNATTSGDKYNVDGGMPNVPTIDGLDSLATFDGSFTAQAGPGAGRDFRFTMVGNDPKLGGTTVYPANLAEVSLELLNADGSVFKTVPFAPFEQLTLQSPNFATLNYSSGNQVEYADAVHRAEFYNVMKQNWHTALAPNVVNKVTLTIPRFVNVQLSNGTVIQARSYFTGTASDGSTFVLMLNLLFNFLFDNEVVNEINSGSFTTNGINTELFPNTFLFSLNVNNPNTPGGCCVLGFHTYFYDPSVFPQPRWVSQYASWISPGLFGGGFEDVTAFSHETSESFDDPFLNNPTPNWQFPGEPANAKVCQANLEVGDPLEVLDDATTIVQVKKQGATYTYHPQNMAMYQWFEMGTTSSALNGAFSFPDPALTRSAIPCPQ